jgi:phytoene dehydrogenase-like protein
MFDVTIVGAGPNGLAAAIHLAANNRRTLVLEAEHEPGGGARTAELTLPGFMHDLGSAVHPLAAASPYFRALPLQRYGLQWIEPPLALAHPLDDGGAACLARSIEETADSLGADGPTYRRLLGPLAREAEVLFIDLLGPLKFPAHPWLAARFAAFALRSARGLAESEFRGERARALFAGLAAHSGLPLTTPSSAAIALVLGIAAHAVGWPIPRGGAGRITQALVDHLRALGGELAVDQPIERVEDLPESQTCFFDLHPEQLMKIAGSRLSRSYRNHLRRFKSGVGTFKLDWALKAPIPWRAPACTRAGTVHLGGTLDEIARSEACPPQGSVAEQPFVLLSQPTLFDPSRAPTGLHIAWAYCHVPLGSKIDMTERIESQIERFAPGFRERILQRRSSFPADLERQNRNLRLGDISGGAPTLMQLFFRPVMSLHPYSIPGPRNWWLCSSSTPPGSGVHGMCGYHAARAALRA